MTLEVSKLTLLLLCLPLMCLSSMVAPSYSKVARIRPLPVLCSTSRGEAGCASRVGTSQTTWNLGLHRDNTGNHAGRRIGFSRTVPSRREDNSHLDSRFYNRHPVYGAQRRYHPSEVGYRPNRPKALETSLPTTDLTPGNGKPESSDKPSNGDTGTSPTDFYVYDDFSDHKSPSSSAASSSSPQAHDEAYNDDYYHNHDHMSTYEDHHPEEENRNKKPYSYYYIGRKLWYIPLYFSVYFIVYVSALLLKSIARHKIVYPLIHWNWKDKRSIDVITQEITSGLENAYQKYG